MWNGSTIQQNPAYVDALSNPFTKQYSQVTINVNAFNGVMTFRSYSQLSWIVQHDVHVCMQLPANLQSAARSKTYLEQK